MSIVYSLGEQRHPKPTLHNFTMSGHVAVLSILSGNTNQVWKSSPYLEGSSDFFVSQRVQFGVSTSGMFFDHYEKLCQGINMGNPLSNKNTGYQNFIKNISFSASHLSQQSMRKAMNQDNENNQGIDIESDATHSACRGASTSNILAISCKCLRIVGSVIITKDDENFSAP